MNKERLRIDLKTALCVLIPISKKEYNRLWAKGVPIFHDYGYYITLSRALEDDAPDFLHSHLYAALKTLFGETPALYDDFKCSFGYPFRLEINKNRQKAKYLLNFTDMKGGFNFYFRKILQEGELNKYERDVLQEPFENEFSKEEMRYFMGWFLFYLVGFMKSYQENYNQEFFRSVEAALMVYGYKGGDFFQEEYDQWDHYQQAIEDLKKTNIPYNQVKPNK
jgi:hypothetical protein